MEMFKKVFKGVGVGLALVLALYILVFVFEFFVSCMSCECRTGAFTYAPARRVREGNTITVVRDADGQVVRDEPRCMSFCQVCDHACTCLTSDGSQMEQNACIPLVNRRYALNITIFCTIVGGTIGLIYGVATTVQDKKAKKRREMEEMAKEVAKQGGADEQFYYAMNFCSGSERKKWLQKASDQGHLEAKSELSRISNQEEAERKRNAENAPIKKEIERIEKEIASEQEKIKWWEDQVENTIRNECGPKDHYTGVPDMLRAEARSRTSKEREKIRELESELSRVKSRLKWAELSNVCTTKGIVLTARNKVYLFVLNNYIYGGLKMAYLTNCPLCNRENVSSESTSCPGCGHNIAADTRKLEAAAAEELRYKAAEEQKERAKNRIKQGQCPKCGKAKFDFSAWDSITWIGEKLKCTECGWEILRGRKSYYDRYEYRECTNEEWDNIFRTIPSSVSDPIIWKACGRCRHCGGFMKTFGGFGGKCESCGRK